MTRKLVVEAIGTFFLVLTVGLVATRTDLGAGAGLAIGSVLMVMVYAGGHISGAHYNPAVTLGVFLRGKATTADLIGYWVAQVIGGGVGGAVAALFVPAPLTIPDLAVGPALLSEFLFTFALVYVVLNTATTRGTEGNSYFGLAIGFTVATAVLAIAPISGAAINPAVSIGVVILGLSEITNLWIYWVAQLAGGIAAALVFRLLDLGSDKPTTATREQQSGLRAAGATQ